MAPGSAQSLARYMASSGVLDAQVSPFFMDFAWFLSLFIHFHGFSKAFCRCQAHDELPGIAPGLEDEGETPLAITPDQDQ